MKNYWRMKDFSIFSVTYAYVDHSSYQADQLFVEGVYTYDDDTITVSYYTGELTEMVLTYEFADDILVINSQIGYSRVTE